VEQFGIPCSPINTPDHEMHPHDLAAAVNKPFVKADLVIHWLVHGVSG